MGTELVVRSGRHISLTSAELQAFADARGLLSRTDQLEQRARRAADGDRGYLSLGSNLDDFHSPLPRLLAGFQHTQRCSYPVTTGSFATVGRRRNRRPTRQRLSHTTASFTCGLAGRIRTTPGAHHRRIAEGASKRQQTRAQPEAFEGRKLRTTRANLRTGFHI
jgi:hypothetical protein